MAVPKQRHTKSRRNKRRSQIFLKAASLSVCPKCGKPILPHTVCKNCGFYKGMEVIDVMKKLNKKEKKLKEKELASKKAEDKKGENLNLQNLSKQ